MGHVTLADLGERRVVSELLAPRFSAVDMFGDDCAVVAAPGGSQTIVVTTDPCPEPMAALLGYTDPYFRGWLLATINLSDIAAAGANPLGLVTSLVLPGGYRVDDFLRLLDGIDDACASNGTRVVGGNLKEGPMIDLSATAIGSVSGRPLSRRGCHPGDRIAVVGDLGLFWAGALNSMKHLEFDAAPESDLMRNILRPNAKVAAGAALRAVGAVTAGMDNSDGLGASLSMLAIANELEFNLEIRDEMFPAVVQRIARRLGVEPLRLVLGWGDWQLVVCVRADRADDANRAVASCGDELHYIGEVSSGPPVVRLQYRGRIGELNPPESERFVPNSWFSAGIDSYVEQLLSDPLFAH